ncbi:hypothetical protein L6R50_16240 [Myxococcota bacterium]|nr:hypothetical protein [Myxococcota bacterium]
MGIESTRRLDRLVSVSSSREGPSPGARASRRLERSVREGIPSVVAAHAAAWAARWEDADVEVLGDDGATRALRFAAYHLVSAANPQDERVSIPARALTGPAYLGHVFWDTEVFMLPFFVFTHPPSARALLMYRWHTLDAARARARAMGYRGALYAWESADTGEEVTPPSVVDPEGRRVRIRNGELEQHVSAAVAFGAWQYAQVADDEEFLAGPGAEILLETARFWASRAVRGEDGLYHVLEAIGPDEYHEAVDDNAYTNGMARWNLRKGLEVLDWLRGRSPDRLGVLEERLGLGGEEPAAWGEIAGAMYDGLDPASGVIEQFRGYFGLEPIDLAAHEPRSAPMDVLLGAERTRRSQVIKQADVVQLVHLLWDELPPRVREASFRYYEPRCGHGSSLSPPVHAVVAARIGDAELAARYFRQTAEIDLADNMGNAAGGVHAAALGGLWQAAVMGFGGLRATASGLAISPRLPPGWRRLRFVARWRGARTVFCIGPGEVRVDVSGARGLRVGLDGGPSVAARPGRGYRAAAVDGGFGAWREVRG